MLYYVDGPRFDEPGPLQRYALFNESLSLNCGTGLDSNPNAMVTWIAPDGTTIMDNARYHIDNGPDIVRLNFTHTILGDTGTWRCDVRVMSRQDIVFSGSLVSLDPIVIGSPIVRDIQLMIVSKCIMSLAIEYDVCGISDPSSQLFQVHLTTSGLILLRLHQFESAGRLHL